MLCNVTRRLGDRKPVILRQRVRGTIRAVRAVRNTRVSLTKTRVVADASGSNEEFGKEEGIMSSLFLEVL